MRYLMIIIVFLLIPNVFFAQQTYVPDDNFEQRLIDYGYDTPPLNDSVPTKNIDTVTYLNVIRENIYDLTGIEDFTALDTLYCINNSLTSLDVSKNTALTYLNCSDNSLTSLYVSGAIELTFLDCRTNQLVSLNVSNNRELTELWCIWNKLTSLDVRGAIALTYLNCYQNRLAILDVSNNKILTKLFCFENRLTSLDIKNGNNFNMQGNPPHTGMDASENPDLDCIQVDDSAASAGYTFWVKDYTAKYSEDCGYTGVEEFLTAGTEISIFPNPAGKNFTVIFELETPKSINLTLTDLSGSKLQEFTLENIQYVNEEIDVSQLSSGVYFLRIDFGSGSVSKKIVVE